MEDGPNYPWTRMESERSGAYDAFKIYLRLGKARSLNAVSDETGKSFSLLRRWSSEYEWVRRSSEYDTYVMTRTTTEDVDGIVHALAESRDKNLALMDKLRTLLDMRLDDFITKRMDPTNNWSKAVEVMARVEQNSLLMGQKAMEKQSDSVLKVADLVKRLEELSTSG